MNERLYPSLKIILFFSLFANVFIPPYYASAEPGAYTFSAGGAVGFLYGQSEEIVYKNSAGDYLSQLLWDMKPLFYYGYTLQFERSKPLQRPGFFTGLSVKYGIPAETGVMEDRDWLDKRDHRLTHFSRHDNFTESMLLFDVKAGCSFPIFHAVVLKVYGLLSFMNFSWDSFDGYTQYASGSYWWLYDEWDEWSASLPKEYCEGRIVGYDQTWVVLGAGFSVALPFSVFNMGLSFNISPFILGASVDNHWLRSLQFNDYLIGGVFLEPGLFADFSPSRHITLALSGSWRLLNGAWGDTYKYEQDNSASYIDKYPNSAGGGLSFFDIKLVITVNTAKF
jgi:outer membrane protease